MANKSFSDKFGDAMRRLLSCCDRQDEEPERPALQISGPTNFRRQDISIEGLTEEQQAFIRQKAITDAQKMWSRLQPLRSSPSGQFASPDDPSSVRISYEDFTVPRPSPKPETGLGYAHRRTTSGQRLAENLRSHGRKLSAPFKGVGYQPVEEDIKREDSKYELRQGLVESQGTQTGGAAAGKMSGESDSVGGSEFGREMSKI